MANPYAGVVTHSKATVAFKMFLLFATSLLSALTFVAGTYAFFWITDMALIENLLILACFSLGIFFMMIFLCLTIGIIFVLMTMAWKCLKPNAKMDVAS